MKPLPLILCVLGLFACIPVNALGAAPKDRHVVVVVWDGMRPGLVSERTTPVLWKLAREGVIFRRHHSVYPTLTNVNGAAMATGAYPNRNGIGANREFRPRIDPKRPFDHAEPEIIKKGDETSDGKYVALSTVAEIVRAAGQRAVIAGAKSVTFLHDRHSDWASAASKNSITRFAAAPMPQNARDEMFRLLGRFLTEPADTVDQRNVYATRALTEILWRDGLPEYSLLWLGDPDLTQHEYSPGAELSMAAIRNSDRNLGVVLDAISKKKAREKTDVLIVSDHGFSTIERSIDFPEVLRAAGFDAVAAFAETPKAGQVMVVGDGGTILFYVIEHDRAVTTRLIEWLQRSDFAGIIFARERAEGTFPLETVRADTADAPDVMVSLRWNPKPNRFGIPGQIITDPSRSAGQGSHGTLSEFDVHNTLIAAGPDFRRGFRSDLSSGNIDLAPTVLQILGLEAPHKFDGRVLSEAMKGGTAPAPATTETLEAKHQFDSGEWHQRLQISRVAGTTYFDEGNGAFDAR